MEAALLQSSDDSDNEATQNQGEREQLAKAKHAALGLLARREYSKAELRERLGRKSELSQGAIEGLLAELAAEGWQSDERFAESFMNSRIAQGKGPLRIRQDMKLKGLDSDLIDVMLDRDSSLWRDLAKSVLDRKYSNANIVDAKEKARRLRFILSRGFPYSLVSDLIRS
jgi:regulatory protein